MAVLQGLAWGRTTPGELPPVPTLPRRATLVLVI